MLLLTFLLLAPLLAGLLCLVIPSPRVMAALGVQAFGITLGLGLALLERVLALGVVTEWDALLSADILSAWMVLLISVVSLSSLEHIGLICTGIALNTPLTIFGALLHMGYHAFCVPCAWSWSVCTTMSRTSARFARTWLSSRRTWTPCA